MLAINIYLISSIFALLGNLFLAFFVLNNNNALLNKLFACFLIALSVWIFGDFFYYFPIVFKIFPTIFWVKLATSGGILCVPLFVHFVYCFVRINNLFRNILLIFLYLIAAVFLVFNIYTNQFVINVTILMKNNLDVKLGPLYYLYSLELFVLLIYCYILIIYSFIFSNTAIRNQLKYFFYATIFILAAVICYFPYMLDIYNIRLDNLFLFFYFATISYAITKHELLGITLIIKRWLATIIVSITVISSFFIVAILAKEFHWDLVWVTMFLGLFWAFATYPAIRLLITTRARKFLKGWYSPEDVLTDINKKIEKEKSKRKIFAFIAEEIYNALEIENMRLLVARRDKEKKLNYFLILDRFLNELGKVDLNDLIIKYLINDPNLISFKELKKNLQQEYSDAEIAEELAKFQEFGFSGKETYFLPFNTPEMLEGVIVVNEKSEGKAFPEKDLTLFRLIIKNVENFFYKLTPYERIESKYFESQEKLHQAEIQLLRTKKFESILHATRQCHHELKTPLAIIRMNTERFTADKIEEHRTLVLKEIDRALSIIKETLTVTDGANGNKKEMIDININEAIQRSLNLVPKNSVQIITYLNEDLPQIKGIFEDLEIVFTNLMNNAMEAMNNQGTITINTRKEGTEVIIEFSDTGKGIPEEMREQVWEPYVSGVKTTAGNSTAGRGWGLTIVHRIITEHKGLISFESKEGKGTTFIIRLPISYASI